VPSPLLDVGDGEDDVVVTPVLIGCEVLTVEVGGAGRVPVDAVVPS
jgi:hypothetical protein